jgi:DNA-binding beta-propeller fold protein YncE
MNISWEINGTIVAENLTTEYCRPNSADLCNPKDIFLDKKNNIFVIDTNNNRIQKYSSSGVITVASQGLNQPQSIYVDNSTDNMYILDFGLNDTLVRGHYEFNYRVQLWYNNSNHGIIIINGTGRSYCMYIDQMLNIYTAEYDYSRIKKWLAHTNYRISITIFVVGWEFNGYIISSSLRYFYFDDEEDIFYIVNPHEYKILKWKLSNNTGTSETIFSVENLKYSNRIITLDCKKNLYFIHPSDNELYRINTSTNQLSKVFVDDNNKWKNVFQNAIGIKFDSFGNIFLIDNEHNRIMKFSIIR